MIRVLPAEALGPFLLGRPLGEATSFLCQTKQKKHSSSSSSPSSSPSSHAKETLPRVVFSPGDARAGGAVVVPLDFILGSSSVTSGLSSSLSSGRSASSADLARRRGTGSGGGDSVDSLLFVLQFGGAAQVLSALELVIPADFAGTDAAQGRSKDQRAAEQQTPWLQYHDAKVRFPVSLAGSLAAFGPAKPGVLTARSFERSPQPQPPVWLGATQPQVRAMHSPPSSGGMAVDTTDKKESASGLGRGSAGDGCATYTVTYPGLAITFEVPTRFGGQLATPEGRAALQRVLTSGRLPDGTSPVARRLRVFCGKSFDERAEPTPVSRNNPDMGELIRVVRAWDGRAGRRRGFSLLFPQRRCQLGFGSSTQDVTALLGPPEGLTSFQKDVMQIHDRSTTQVTSADAVYHYYSMGIDVRFDSTTLCAKKFVLHTNAPGHATFGTHLRCNFVIALGGGDAAQDPVIFPTSTMDEIRAALSSCGEELSDSSGAEPLVVAQAQAEGVPSLILGTDEGLVFETVSEGGALAVVTIFE